MAPVVFDRAEVRPPRSQPIDNPNPNVDFAVARSPEQLAMSFSAFFAPAPDHGEDDQVSYVFG
jgi:hypothetical protein